MIFVIIKKVDINILEKYILYNIKNDITKELFKVWKMPSKYTSKSKFSLLLLKFHLIII